MTAVSMRARLTVWFAVALGCVLVVLAGAMWWALRDSIDDTVDASLANRALAVERFLNQPGTAESFEELKEDLREFVLLDPGWSLLRIRDVRGAQLYRSDAFDVLAVSPDALAGAAPVSAYRDLVMRGLPVRMLTSRIVVRQQPYTVEVGALTGELEEVIDQFRWVVVILVPCGLVAAVLGGYWISRRALAPIDRISAAARAITAPRLGRRLDVPPTGDELQRLTETLNDMLARLEAAFRETTRFTADASHELRTPVAFIRASAEVALRRPRSAEDYRAALEEILREAERTSVLVQDLLTLTRSDAGVADLEPTRLDLGALLAGMCPQFEAMCASHGLVFSWVACQAPLEVLGDHRALGRLATILIDNAVKYTPASGSVRLAANEADGHVVVTVTDTGMGIEAADVPRVFDRFYRADQARSRDSGGAGLGLSIAKWIVDQHAGRITIGSEPGRGCVVQVQIPAPGIASAAVPRKSDPV